MKNALNLLIIIGLSIAFTSFLIKQTTGFYQFVVDQAYNKGRTMEQVCAKSKLENVPLDCSHHYRDTNHNLTPSIYE